MVSINLTKDQADLLLKLLQNAKRSENINDYIDEDSWGPSAGIAANNAKKINKNINEFIKLIEVQSKTK